MKHWLIAAAALLLTVSGSAFSWEKVPATGTVHVKFLVPRNAPILVADQGFYFVIDVNVPIGSEVRDGPAQLDRISGFLSGRPAG